MHFRSALSLSAVVVVVVVSAIACGPGATGSSSCNPPCATKGKACDGCPPLAEQLCIDDTCRPRGDDTVDVTGTLNLTDGLTSASAVIVSVVDGRTASCISVGSAQTAQNVLAGRRVSMSGGPTHTDVDFGRVPGGFVVVAADAIDAAGKTIGFGCVLKSTSGSTTNIGFIQIQPKT